MASIRSLLMISFLAAALCAVSADTKAQTPPGTGDLQKIAAELESNLDRHILSLWYPRAIDTEIGGFREGFDEEWRPTGSPTLRSIVYQSRLTWTAAEALRLGHGEQELMKRAVLHGVEALREQLWDDEEGGFYWQVDGATGRPVDSSGEKHAYGNSFGIYALAAAHLATKNAAALELAKKAFLWLDRHAHDPKTGGYFEALARDGKPLMAPPAPGRRDVIGTRYGFKSMNSHIHLLEALTALHRVWPDRRVKSRLQELFKIVRDRVYVDPGCLHLYFNPDWRPVPDHDSFGHDVETAYLLVEAAEELGIPEDPAAWRAAKRLVDHALEVGWDARNGGFFDHGSAFGPATGLDKVWWTQAEGLNALLLMHEHYGRSGPKYLLAFVRQWEFIKTHQVDGRHRGWITSVEHDGKAKPGQSKSDMWKDPYHQGRAVMNVLSRLKQPGDRGPAP